MSESEPIPDLEGLLRRDKTSKYVRVGRIWCVSLIGCKCNWPVQTNVSKVEGAECNVNPNTVTDDSQHIYALLRYPLAPQTHFLQSRFFFLPLLPPGSFLILFPIIYSLRGTKISCALGVPHFRSSINRDMNLYAPCIWLYPRPDAFTALDSRWRDLEWTSQERKLMYLEIRG
jgi:hypothetical protein